MKSIITILALMLTFSGIAQNPLSDYKVQKIIKENSTAFIGKTDQGLIAYNTSSEGKLSLGYFNASNDYTEINHASLGDYRVEKAFLRKGNVVLITSNRETLSKMDKKKRGSNASLYFNTLTINIETKEVKKKIKALKYLFVPGNRVSIEESPNQKFMVIWYGVQIIEKTIVSHFTVLGADFSKVYSKTYTEDRVKYEYKNLASVLVSNTGDLAIMTKGNYSPKTHKIIPLRLDYYLDPEVDGDDYPGLYTLTNKKYVYMTNHIAIHCFGKEKKMVKFDIDFERQYEFVVRKGCKMIWDQDGLIHVAGLFSDGYSTIHAKGIFHLELNPETGERKDIYHEYFSKDFVIKVLPTEKLKQKALALFAQDKHPNIDELEVRDFQLTKEGVSLLVLEYINYKIAPNGSGIMIGKAFSGNLVFLELSKNNEISWFSSIEKKQFFAFPKNLYGVNKIFTAFDSESGFTVLFNEWKPTDKLKKKSKFGVDVDFPKLVGYTVSLDGTVSKKTTLYDSSDNGVLLLPNKSIRMDANQFILKGDKEREITYFNLSK